MRLNFHFFKSISCCPNTTLCKVHPFTSGLGLHLDHKCPCIHMGLSPDASPAPRVSLSFPVPISHCLYRFTALFQAGILAPKRNEGTQRAIIPPSGRPTHFFPIQPSFYPHKSPLGRTTVHILQMRTPRFRQFSAFTQLLQDGRGGVQVGPRLPALPTARPHPP